MCIISVLRYVHREVKMDSSDERNGNIPGCQAEFVKGGIENEKQGSEVNRFVY